MKRILLSVLCLSVFLSTQTYAASSERIKEFFKNSHEEFIDYHWLRPIELYREAPYYNSSHFTTSHLVVTYPKKAGPIPIFETLSDYVDDVPLHKKHDLNFRIIHYQSYKMVDDKRLEQYDVIEQDDHELRVVHKLHRFTIGTFDKTGQFDVLNWNTNGQMDLQFWNKVHFDPWTQSMFFKLFISDDNERQTHVDYNANADQFPFLFKGEDSSEVRMAQLDVVNIPGFKNPAVVFVYNGKMRPIAKEQDSKITWTDDTITFDVWYRFDEQKLWVDNQGIVHLGLTSSEY